MAGESVGPGSIIGVGIGGQSVGVAYLDFPGGSGACSWLGPAAALSGSALGIIVVIASKTNGGLSGADHKESDKGK